MASHKVLIVEDSATMRQLLSFALQRLKVTIVQAGNGLEGLKIIQGGGIDVALVDINMPIMDGLKMIKHLREDATYRSLPVIVITTESHPETMDKARHLGVSHFITKPIKQADVIEKVRGLLEGS